MSQEIQLQHLLGKRVRDVSGRTIGRIEEVRAENVNGEIVVSDFLLGPKAWLQRISASGLLPFGGKRRMRKIPWSQLDFADPSRPKLKS